MQFNTLSSILFLSGLICANVMIVLWRRRKVRGAKWLSMAMLSMSIWGIAAAFEMAAATVEAKILISKIQYIGVISSSPLLLIFAYNHFTFHSNEISAKESAYQALSLTRWMPLLWVIPAITLILVWTNELHNLIWTGYHFIPAPSGNILVYSHGAWFWGFITFTYMTLALAIILLALTAIRMWRISPIQSLTLLSSLPLPIIANSFYVFFPDQLAGVDLTPVGFALTGIILTIGIYNFQLLDLTPFTREIVMDYLPEAIIVVDNRNRVLDINSNFNRILGDAHRLMPGDKIDHLLSNWLPPEIASSGCGQYQVTLQREDGEEDAFFVFKGAKRVFDLSILPFQLKSRSSGRLMIFSDVTDRIANEDLLSETNEKLNTQLVEIHILKDQIEELVVRDALTGLYNRRFLNDTMSREIARAGREHYTISVAMIDVDHFKSYNDSFGHQAGDEVLIRLARHLVENVREVMWWCVSAAKNSSSCCPLHRPTSPLAG
jgi:PAS domain-containing protein